jgi:queuine tRNA-ribosyltransferase
MQFKLTHTDNNSSARRGIITTDHGNIDTPAFMPVGTAGAVKAVHIPELTNEIHAQIILSNTYHLYLRPGTQILEKAGGLHKFNGWKGPILTDSGGYQVYSLTERRKLNADGVLFHSHIDGSKHMFTPENVMDIQRSIGADIIMAFDECTPWPCDYKYASESLKITHSWLKRCFDRFTTTEPLYGHRQSLFPIVQGSTFRDLRIQSAEVISAYEADGNAIGGLSVGEPAEQMYEMTELVCGILPKEKPRYLMGVGTPVNILENIALGVDMFDCVMPTRNGRNGMIFTSQGIINLRNEKWKDNFSPLDPDGTSSVDHFYTRAYVKHLFKAGEMLGPMIASIHNLAFYQWLVAQARTHIEQGDFTQWKNSMVKQLATRL